MLDQMMRNRIQNSLRNLCASRIVEKDEIAAPSKSREHRAYELDWEFPAAGKLTGV
jgi:hypothetical protein